MLTHPFYCIDYAPSGRQRYVTTSNHSRGPFYYDNLFSFPLDYYEGVCEDYITDELEQRRAERLFHDHSHREHMNRDRDREDLLMLERIRQAEIQERERLLDEERRAAAAAAASVERERRLQRLIHEKRRHEKETAARRRRHMNMLLKKSQSQPSYRTIRHDPETLFFNPMITTKIPIYEEMTDHTTTKKEMPYQPANPSSCQQAIPISMSMSSAPNIRCNAKTSSTPSIHAKAVTAQKKKNPIVSIRESLPLHVQVEDASDSECEDEFSDYIRNRRPRDGEWIEPVEAFQRL